MKFLSKSKLFSTAIIYVGTDIVNKAMPFLLLPIITRYLLPAEFGVVSNFLMLLTVFVILVGLGVDGAISANYYKLNESRISKYVSNATLITLLSAVFLTAIIFLFKSSLYKITAIPFEYQLLAVFTALFQIFTTINLTIWRLEEKPFKFGIYLILQTLFNVGLSLYFIVILERGWKGRAEGYAFSIIIFGLISLFILYKRGYLKFTKFQKYYFYSILFFGLPLIPHSIGIWIRTGIDRFIITNQSGEAAVGIYSTSIQFGLLFSFVSIAFNNAFIPYLFKKLSSKNEENKSEIDTNIVMLSYKVALLYLGFSVGIIVLSKLLIEYILPVSYSEAEKFVPWIVITQLFQGFYMLVGNYIFFAKRTKPLAYVSFFVAIFHSVFCYFMVSKFGPMGAAYSAAISSVINFLAVWYLSNAVYPMPWFKIKIWR